MTRSLLNSNSSISWSFHPFYLGRRPDRSGGCCCGRRIFSLNDLTWSSWIPQEDPPPRPYNKSKGSSSWRSCGKMALLGGAESCINSSAWGAATHPTPLGPGSHPGRHPSCPECYPGPGFPRQRCRCCAGRHPEPRGRWRCRRRSPIGRWGSASNRKGNSRAGRPRLNSNRPATAICKWDHLKPSRFLEILPGLPQVPPSVRDKSWRCRDPHLNQLNRKWPIIIAPLPYQYLVDEFQADRSRLLSVEWWNGIDNWWGIVGRFAAWVDCGGLCMQMRWVTGWRRWRWFDIIDGPGRHFGRAALEIVKYVAAWLCSFVETEWNKWKRGMKKEGNDGGRCDVVEAIIIIQSVRHPVMALASAAISHLYSPLFGRILTWPSSSSSSSSFFSSFFSSSSSSSSFCFSPPPSLPPPPPSSVNNIRKHP